MKGIADSWKRANPVGKLGMLGSGCLAGLGALITFCFACTATMDVAGVLPTLSPTAVVAQAVSSNTPQATYTLASTVTPRSTVTPAPTNIPSPTNTLIPTDTPIPPTDTPLPTDTPIPPTSTATLSPTPIPIVATPTLKGIQYQFNALYQDIQASWNEYTNGEMTLLQFRAHLDSLKGKQDYWEGKVNQANGMNVQVEGQPMTIVWLDMQPELCLFCEVRINGLPYDTTLALRPGDTLRFRGTFAGYQVGVFGDNVTIVIESVKFIK
jgi:hypothetical protein